MNIKKGFRWLFLEVLFELSEDFWSRKVPRSWLSLEEINSILSFVRETLFPEIWFLKYIWNWKRYFVQGYDRWFVSTWIDLTLLCFSIEGLLWTVYFLIEQITDLYDFLKLFNPLTKPSGLFDAMLILWPDRRVLLIKPFTLWPKLLACLITCWPFYETHSCVDMRLTHLFLWNDNPTCLLPEVQENTGVYHCTIWKYEVKIM